MIVCRENRAGAECAGCGEQNNRKRNVAAANQPSWTQTLARKGFRSLRKSLRSHSDRLTTGVTPADNRRRLPLACSRQVEGYCTLYKDVQERKMYIYTSSISNWMQGHAIVAPLSQTTCMQNSLKIHTKYNVIVHGSTLVRQTGFNPYSSSCKIWITINPQTSNWNVIHSSYMSSTTYFSIISLTT